ncbi:CRISPR-associated endonuclease Cas1 [Propionivibrio sp.]|uniref:CRISPR-associated endonuclease Cas1 n=1 Tax=Propionivibrio sp. TaxID=2212460 RepID=UPI003BF2A06B
MNDVARCLYLVCYDIANPRRLRQVHKFLLGYKVGGQLNFIIERRDADLLHRYPLVTCERQLAGLITRIDAQENIAALRGLEGAAAAIYFEALTEIVPESLHFNNRNRRPPKDPVNTLLSLTYTLLHAEAVLACDLFSLLFSADFPVCRYFPVNSR